MPTPLYRILACAIPLQIASMVAWTAYATRPPAAEQVDHLVVSKANHTLTLFSHNKPIRTYKVALGQKSGAKQQEGDNRTPEGHYTIDGHNAHSTCHLALHISYPSAADRARAAAAHYAPGGDVEIHGLPNTYHGPQALQHLYDWTYGCIAVTDAEMDEIYRLVPNGTPIDIER